MQQTICLSNWMWKPTWTNKHETKKPQNKKTQRKTQIDKEEIDFISDLLSVIMHFKNDAL